MTNNASTTKTDLIERYIYAATRYLPRKDRDEVTRELDSLITDMLEERTGGLAPTDKDIRVVLTELGTPQEVAAQYGYEGDKALISGTYFVMYKRLLMLVLPIVAAALPMAILMSTIFGEGISAANLGLVIGRILGGTFGGLFQAFAVITLIFAVFERFNVDFTEEEDPLANLPVIPKGEEIKPWEPLVGIAFGVLFLIVFLWFPQIVGVWVEGEGWIPLFNLDAIRAMWFFIGIWVALGILKEIRKLIEGRYAKQLAILVGIANMFIASCAIFIFGHSGVINPTFVVYINNLFVGEDVAPIIELAVANFNLVFLAIVLFALVAETVTAVVQAYRTHEN